MDWGAKQDCSKCKVDQWGEQQCSKLCCEKCHASNQGIDAEESVSLESPETPQTYNEMISPSFFPSLQYILAAIGVLALFYGAFNLCFYKNAYYSVPSQEEV
jgi:hypothetical protein